MKNTIIVLLLIAIYSTAQCCSFDVVPFCQTVNDKNPDDVIMRGYFSGELENGLVFTRLETLRGDEERSEIKIWDNLPFECTGLWLRPASYLGDIDEEIIISLSPIDTVYFGTEVDGDYRVPEGLYWETHNLKVVGDSIYGFSFYSSYESDFITISYNDFIENTLENSSCTITSTKEESNQHLTIFPTLVSDYIYLDYNSALENSRTIIYDTNGRLVLSQPISPSIHLGVLEKGMYIIVVQTIDNICYHQKIVKI